MLLLRSTIEDKTTYVKVRQVTCPDIDFTQQLASRVDFQDKAVARPCMCCAEE